MDVVSLWGFSVDAELTRIDFGDVPARSSGDFRFRLKNRSMQYRATGITLAVEGAQAAQFLLSTDGAAFTATLTMGDLAPQATTGTVYLRRVTPANAPVGTFACTIRAHPTGWAQYLTT